MMATVVMVVLLVADMAAMRAVVELVVAIVELAAIFVTSAGGAACESSDPRPAVRKTEDTAALRERSRRCGQNCQQGKQRGESAAHGSHAKKIAEAPL